jgi:hypothetical protein
MITPTVAQSYERVINIMIFFHLLFLFFAKEVVRRYREILFHRYSLSGLSIRIECIVVLMTPEL